MTRLRRITSVAAVTMSAVLGLSACSSTSPTAGPTTTARTSAASATATPSTAATTSKAPATERRTVATLKAALLDKSDLPAGFSLDSSGSSGPSPKSTSKNPNCASFNRLMNLDKAPGSTAEAQVTMDGGQNGPAIEQSLNALGSSAAVTALTKRLRSAVNDCGSIKLTMPTGESSTMSVASVTAPSAGAGPVAARLAATSGPLAGLELTMVWTGVDDVLLTMTFTGSLPEDIDGATQGAVEKAQQALRTGSTSS